MKRIHDYSLYLVISQDYSKGKSALDIASAAISGGADILQMREKDKPGGELIRIGNELSRFCRKRDVTFIVNDDPLLAKKVEADGVHLGQEDLKRHTIASARRIIGKDSIIGISCDSVELVKSACAESIDYIAFGPVYPTTVKDYCVGTDHIKEVLTLATKPVFFIGGITLDNLGMLLEKGVKNIALIRDILEADDIESRTRMFKERLASEMAAGKKRG